MVSCVPEYFNDKFLKKDKMLFRHYQNNIVNSCKNKNSLVVLPTGLGKTIIGILLIADSLKKYPQSKILIVAPTRPLVAQHRSSCKNFLNIQEDEIVLLTGKITPDRRISLFNESKIIISTPQVIKNDLSTGRYDLKHISLIIFDECHRTKGNYAYNFISEEYSNSCSDPLILGLTASPGKDYINIQELCNNLYIENIVFKTHEDADVKEYIFEIDTFLERVDLPLKFIEISQVWQHLFKKFLRFFIERNLINPYKRYYSKLDFLRISNDISLSLRYENDSEANEEDYLNQLNFHNPKLIEIVKEKKLDIQSIFSYCSSCISILHAKDLLETQDITLFLSFVNKIQEKADRDILSAKRITNSKHFKLIKKLTENEIKEKLKHPKIEKLISIIRDEILEFNNKRIIIFTQYREMAELIKNILENNFMNDLVINKFIGQASRIDDCGFSQHKQIEILDNFRKGEINILIATSVAEEGLDIPNVDGVIFYEPVPSEIRLIQRRGRTGRVAPGRCYILITEDTVDIPFYIVANRKEKQMNEILLEPDQLSLIKDIKRKEIGFNDSNSNLKQVKNFYKRREMEKELLANRSCEDIIIELDNFVNSRDYQNLKDSGVSFYSDLIQFNSDNLKEKIKHFKGTRSSIPKEKKRYLNKKLKAIVNLTKFYCEEGKIKLERLQTLAQEEDIIDRNFYIHFNQACNLGFLKKDSNNVYFINDYE